MIKLDERSLYAFARMHGRHPGVLQMLAIRERLLMPEKRFYYILGKWADRGWWEYGVSLRGGWFTEFAPGALGVWGALNPRSPSPE